MLELEDLICIGRAALTVIMATSLIHSHLDLHKKYEAPQQNDTVGTAHSQLRLMIRTNK